MTNVAVLIDGDNIAAKWLPQVLAEAEKLGRVEVVRVYADAAHVDGWLGVPGVRLFHSGGGKNATDMLLCLDAMELALYAQREAFVIASSDQDYAHLALRLREYGCAVLGLGEATAPAALRAACAQFVVLAKATKAQPAPVAAPAASSRANGVSEVDLAIKSLIAAHSKQGRGMALAKLGPQMGHAGVRISQMPDKTWRRYFELRPKLYDLDPKGPEAMVRFLPEGFTATP